MTPPAPPRRPGRPPNPPPAPATDVDVAARLDAIIERGIGAIETEMDVMLEPLPGGGVFADIGCACEVRTVVDRDPGDEDRS